MMIVLHAIPTILYAAAAAAEQYHIDGSLQGTSRLTHVRPPNHCPLANARWIVYRVGVDDWSLHPLHHGERGGVPSCAAVVADE